jgi:hypothetical protein
VFTEPLPSNDRGINRKRHREKRKNVGEVVRDTALGGQVTISPVFKVPRQCRLVLLVEVMHMIRMNFL